MESDSPASAIRSWRMGRTCMRGDGSGSAERERNRAEVQRRRTDPSESSLLNGESEGFDCASSRPNRLQSKRRLALRAVLSKGG
jgi:hypothetical protein